MTQTLNPETEDVRLCTLEVFIIGGPITENFAKRNLVISRTIKQEPAPIPG